MPPSGDPAGAGRRRSGADGRRPRRYAAGRYAARPRPPGAPPVNFGQVGHAACGRGLGRPQRGWRSLRTRPHHMIECASTHRAVSADPRTFVVSALSAHGRVRGGHVRPDWLIVEAGASGHQIAAVRARCGGDEREAIGRARCASVQAGRDVPGADWWYMTGLVRSRRRGRRFAARTARRPVDMRSAFPTRSCATRWSAYPRSDRRQIVSALAGGRRALRSIRLPAATATSAAIATEYARAVRCRPKCAVATAAITTGDAEPEEGDDGRWRRWSFRRVLSGRRPARSECG